MPSPESNDLIHAAVVWAYAKRDRFGNLKLSGAKQIDCRWKQKVRMATGPDGNPVAIEATVRVPEAIRVGSVMWKGELKDWDDALKDDLFEVVFYNEADDLKGRDTARSVDLKRYRANLPAGTP